MFKEDKKCHKLNHAFCPPVLKMHSTVNLKIIIWQCPNQVSDFVSNDSPPIFTHIFRSCADGCMTTTGEGKQGVPKASVFLTLTYSNGIGKTERLHLNSRRICYRSAAHVKTVIFRFCMVFFTSISQCHSPCRNPILFSTSTRLHIRAHQTEGQRKRTLKMKIEIFVLFLILKATNLLLKRVSTSTRLVRRSEVRCTQAREALGI